MSGAGQDAIDESGRRLVIDRTLCEGHARCETVAPELFEVGDDDQAQLLVDYLSDATLADADSAVSECPRGALSWVGGDATGDATKDRR